MLLMYKLAMAPHPYAFTSSIPNWQVLTKGCGFLRKRDDVTMCICIYMDNEGNATFEAYKIHSIQVHFDTVLISHMVITYQ